MEPTKTMETPVSATLGSWLMLPKPGIIFGNAVTGFAGFALASQGHFDLTLLGATLAGLCLIIASACVFNNSMDRKSDAKMQRTKERALARGLIRPQYALLFGVLIGLLGLMLLAAFTPLLTLTTALFGLLVYVFCYTPAKYRTVHATLIGSIAGAIPPVVGYTAVSGTIDGGALLLFLLIVLWQMPHFYAIAIYRMDDYAAASIPVLPLVKGLRTTKIQMLLYVGAFTAVSSLLTFFGYTGIAWLIVAALFGFTWFWMGIQGFLLCDDDRKWARTMFVNSLIVVMGLSIALPFCIV